MNTLLDRFDFNREHASRHLTDPDRGWWIAGTAAAMVFVLLWVFAAL